MTRSKGCDWWRRKTSLSFRSSAVRFLSLGVYCAHHAPRRLRTRRKSKPRKPKLSPRPRSTFRLFSSLISTCSLANSSRSRLYRPHQPIMSWVGVNQDHQVIRKSCVLDVGVLAVARGLFRPLQHPVHLGEVKVTEQR